MTGFRLFADSVLVLFKGGSDYYALDLRKI